MADFLQFSGQTFLVMGVANRKSVAWLTAKTLEEQGARVVYSVRSPTRRQSLETLLAELRECDPVTFERIDRQNPRRVIRALEVIRQIRPSPPVANITALA